MNYTKKRLSAPVAALFFFYIYGVTFVFFPVSTFIFYGALGLLTLAVKKTFDFDLNRKVIHYCFYYSLPFIFSFIAILANGTLDLVFLRNISAFVFYIFAAVFVLELSKEHVKTNDDIMRYFTAACTAQAVITLLSFFNLGFRGFLRNIQIYDDTAAAKYEQLSYRAFGLGSWFDAGSVVMGFSLIFIIYLYLNDKEKNKLGYITMYFIQLLAGILTARTIIVAFGLSGIYLLTAPRRYNRRKWFAIKTVLLFAAAVAALLLLFFQDFIEKYMGTIQWAFRLFISLMDGGKTQVGSLDTLFGRMYFMPDLKTLLMGDGLVVNHDGSYYMRTDAGYMRYLLFFGVFGLASFLVYEVYLALTMFGGEDNKLLKNMAIIFIVYFLISFLKFRTNLAGPASLFFTLHYIVNVRRPTPS